MKRIIATLLLVLSWTALVSCSKPADPDRASGTRNAAQTITEEPTVKESVHTTSPAFGCDALFFGDSITADSNFDEYFRDLRIVNLGVYGDTINDLMYRVADVKAKNPAKIFLMVGINCLRDYNVEDCLADYAKLTAAIRSFCPEALLCIQSVLPLSAEFGAYYDCSNASIREFNDGLRTLAAEKGLPFIDLFPLYEKDGALDPAMTRDGIHLNFNCYGPWAEAIAPYLNND